MALSLSLSHIREAHNRIEKYIHRTPILTCSSLDRIAGARLFFKCENFQKAGAFKFRGAMNAVTSLSSDEADLGVVTHSSGNHAGALALAASIRGIPAYIVMPENAPAVKKAAVAGYGARITSCGTTMSSRERVSEQVVKETGGILIHPFDDDRIIAGQGTSALELVDDLNDLDAILAPVSGGGLLSGTALAARGIKPGIMVFGCEPENAGDAYMSLREGKLVAIDNPETIADGLRASLGERTFPIVRELVDDIFLVTEEEIIRAMRMIWERMKIVVEPSGAVPFAVLLGKRPQLYGKKVGVILSGGNVDLEKLPF